MHSQISSWQAGKECVSCVSQQKCSIPRRTIDHLHSSGSLTTFETKADKPGENNRQLHPASPGYFKCVSGFCFLGNVLVQVTRMDSTPAIHQLSGWELGVGWGGVGDYIWDECGFGSPKIGVFIPLHQQRFH